jgi:hypothetical protein
MMKLTSQFQKLLVEDTCQEVLDVEHPVPVEAVGGQKPLVFAGSCEPGDEGLTIGAPGRQGTDPHGHQRLAPVSAGEKPLPAAVTRVVREGDKAVMVGEGVGHA